MTVATATCPPQQGRRRAPDQPLDGPGGRPLFRDRPVASYGNNRRIGAGRGPHPEPARVPRPWGRFGPARVQDSADDPRFSPIRSGQKTGDDPGPTIKRRCQTAPWARNKEPFERRGKCLSSATYGMNPPSKHQRQRPPRMISIVEDHETSNRGNQVKALGVFPKAWNAWSPSGFRNRPYEPPRQRGPPAPTGRRDVAGVLPNTRRPADGRSGSACRISCVQRRTDTG